MIQPIVKDVAFLSKPLESVQKVSEVKSIINDLQDTAEYYKNRCVGLTANQIGYDKQVIVVLMNGVFVPMVNPHIVKQYGTPFTAIEGCMSLTGERSVQRYRRIKVAYKNRTGKTMLSEYGGFIAQVIQHEVDHCKGKLI